MRSIHGVYADDIEFMGNRQRIREDVQHNKPFNKRRGRIIQERANNLAIDLFCKIR